MPDILQQNLAMIRKALLELVKLQTMTVTLPYYANVFIRLCTKPLTFFFSFQNDAIVISKHPSSFQAFPSVKEAYKPNPPGSDVL